MPCKVCMNNVCCHGGDKFCDEMQCCDPCLCLCGGYPVNKYDLGFDAEPIGNMEVKDEVSNE